MFRWISQKHKERKERKQIERLPWFAKKRYSMERKRKIGKRSLLSYDYGNRKIGGD